MRDGIDSKTMEENRPRTHSLQPPAQKTTPQPPQQGAHSAKPCSLLTSPVCFQFRTTGEGQALSLEQAHRHPASREPASSVPGPQPPVTPEFRAHLKLDPKGERLSPTVRELRSHRAGIAVPAAPASLVVCEFHPSCFASFIP